MPKKLLKSKSKSGSLTKKPLMMKKLSKVKTIKNKKTQTKKKTKKTKKTKKSRSLIRKIKISKPMILYSQNPVTGEETTTRALSIKNDQGGKTFAIAVEKNLPPSYYRKNNGTNVYSMSRQKQIVVESYKGM